MALGCQLLARNLALGFQLHDAQGRPTILREPRAFRATQVEGLGLFERHQSLLLLRPLQPSVPHIWTLPWTRQVVRLIACGLNNDFHARHTPIDGEYRRVA